MVSSIMQIVTTKVSRYCHGHVTVLCVGLYYSGLGKRCSEAEQRELGTAETMDHCSSFLIMCRGRKRSLKLKWQVKLRCVKDRTERLTGVYFHFSLVAVHTTAERGKKRVDTCVKNSSSQQTNTVSSWRKKETKKDAV